MKLPAGIALIIAFFSTTSLISVPVMAQNLYHYLDDNGKTVIAGSLPAGISARGYEVIDSYGRVIEIIPPHQTRSSAATLAKETEQLQQNEWVKVSY